MLSGSFFDSIESISRCLFECSQTPEWNDVMSKQPVTSQENYRKNVEANPKKQPNILKRKDPLPKPIENLPFSPSRFLSDPSGSYSITEDETQEISLACPSPVRQSPLNENQDDLDGLFALPSLTSTPICKKFQQDVITPNKIDAYLGSPLKTTASLHVSSISPQHTMDDFTKSDSAMYSCSDTAFKTPQISKYLSKLDHTGPLTPTPFKCESNEEENDDGGFYSNLLYSSMAYDNDFAALTLPTQTSHTMVSSSKLTKISPHRSRKRARKALVLDQDWSLSVFPNENTRNPCRDDTPLATKLPDNGQKEDLGFVSLELTPSSSNMRVRRVSGLVDDRTIVRKRFSVGRKSFFYTSHSDQSVGHKNEWRKPKAPKTLNQKWVSIACGHSEDQKAMTRAARKFFPNRYKTNSSTLSSQVLRNSIHSNLR